MRRALIALDSLEGGPGPWTFGGGTALAQILDHRISYDIDIFLDSSASLKSLAPNINPVTKSLCDTWQWPGKYLKLVLNDVGEIDFLNAPSYIDNPTYPLQFGERSIAAERSAEIATKKLVYRASTFTARDTFDLASIHFYEHSALAEIAQSPESSTNHAKLPCRHLCRLGIQSPKTRRGRPAGCRLLETAKLARVPCNAIPCLR